MVVVIFLFAVLDKQLLKRLIPLIPPPVCIYVHVRRWLTPSLHVGMCQSTKATRSRTGARSAALNVQAVVGCYLRSRSHRKIILRNMLRVPPPIRSSLSLGGGFHYGINSVHCLSGVYDVRFYRSWNQVYHMSVFMFSWIARMGSLFGYERGSRGSTNVCLLVEAPCGGKHGFWFLIAVHDAHGLRHALW